MSASPLNETASNNAGLRHLLRRLCFASTPALEQQLQGLDVQAARSRIWSGSLAQAAPPTLLTSRWENIALAKRTLSAEERAANLAIQQARHEEAIGQLRESWIAQLATSPAPLRANFTLFLYGLFGSSARIVGIPQALEQRHLLLWRQSMGTVPDLLEALIVDPAMMIQIGSDGHGFDRVSDRPAKLVLDHWTVGTGAYADRDVEELSRALTGWSLTATDAIPATDLDSAAPLAELRQGIVPRFEADAFDSEPKTLLGTTASFDARSAVRHLALHPATARRFSAQLLGHFGVVDPDDRLLAKLERTYLDSGGSIEALLIDIVAAEEFWSDATRWSLIKSPAHLAAGACRQLGLGDVPAREIDSWLTACGQPLFETPNNGEGGWANREAWVTPPDRLALRYGLARLLAPEANDRRRNDINGWLDRLDPAPGLNAASVRGRNAAAVIAAVIGSPQYQLA